MRKIKNEKGFTLVEILVVIAIISILFVVLLPQLNAAWQKVYTSQVRNDFRGFQLAAEAYMMDTLGDNMKTEKFNKDLDHSMKFDVSTLASNHEDPWGSKYTLKMDLGRILIRSNGMDEVSGNEDDYLLAVYYYKGMVDTCTSGFVTNNIQLMDIKLPANGVCGDNPV